MNGQATINEPPVCLPRNLQENDWKLLLDRIRSHNCIPIIGGAIHRPRCVKPGEELAGLWATTYEYPLDDKNDLARVARFVAIENDDYFPRDQIVSQIRATPPPDFSNPAEPHRVLADLELPLYLTTNYDGLMYQALKYRQKDAQYEYCRWKEDLRYQPSLFETKEVKINEANPLVYHFHGHVDEPTSLVVTEDDYLDYLANLAADKMLIPPVIQSALRRSALMFIGYQLTDWDFRVLFRSLAFFLKRSQMVNVAVQLVPLIDQTQTVRVTEAVDFLDKYFDDYKVRVFWGDCHQFVEELRRRLV